MSGAMECMLVDGKHNCDFKNEEFLPSNNRFKSEAMMMWFAALSPDWKQIDEKLLQERASCNKMFEEFPKQYRLIRDLFSQENTAFLERLGRAFDKDPRQRP